MGETEVSADAREQPRGDSGGAGENPEREASSAGAEDETPRGEMPDDAAKLRALDDEALLELKKLAEERDLFRDEALRVRADLDNYQKRVRRDRPKWRDQAVREFVSEILPVVDNFELALSSAGSGESRVDDGLRQGVELIYQMTRKVLEDNGVEEIGALGEMFDPEVHDAVAEAEVEEGETGRIVDVQQKGYVHKGVVVRPSRVTVAKRKEAENDRADGDIDEPE